MGWLSNSIYPPFNWGRRAKGNLIEVNKAAEVIPLNNPLENVTDIIEDRASRFMAYRDASYAQQYRNYLNQIGEKDAEVGANDQLTRAVSKYLFKVMAYKDEYEVARLQTDVSFQRELDNIFEGDYKIEYHLAPPMLSKTDDNGQPV